jgi:putative hydrolase of the HAD superfamily
MNLQQIKAIVFDLDGTLYVSEAFEQAIWKSVSRYAAQLLGVSAEVGGQQLRELRDHLTAERGTVQTLAVAIVVMGGTVPEMHRRFAQELEPGQFIQPDPRVKLLVEQLGKRYTSWLLTNNNQTLTHKILACLDLEQSFHRVLTINDTWRPKPDQTVLDQVLRELDLPPEAVLFVGDRYDIDLLLPEKQGCPVLLTKTIDELMQLETLLH